uniref:CACTA en-spm transposon protein n=1 Tax=Globodera pallida TaxID=36090 RepID=A0A183CA43_GLOPA
MEMQQLELNLPTSSDSNESVNKSEIPLHSKESVAFYRDPYNKPELEHTLRGLLHGSASLKKHKAFKFASAKWTPGSGVYDAARCGLPFYANNNASSANAKLHRSKRFCDDGERNRKMQGGEAAEEGQFPWAVALARGEAAENNFFVLEPSSPSVMCSQLRIALQMKSLRFSCAHAAYNQNSTPSLPRAM